MPLSSLSTGTVFKLWLLVDNNLSIFLKTHELSSWRLIKDITLIIAILLKEGEPIY